MTSLRLVPERAYTTTLREYAGGNESNDAIEYFLQKKIGHTVVFIRTASLLLFESEQGSIADIADNLEGSVCVGFSSVEKHIMPIASYLPDRRLGVIPDISVTAALFHTALHSYSLTKTQRLRTADGVALGARYPRVGMMLDQPVEFLETEEALPLMRTRPLLRAVE